jgi:hypothetical protein
MEMRMRELLNNVDINKDEAVWIAQGLRALASCDGLEAAELAMVENLEQELEIASTAHDRFDADASPLRGDAQQAVFVRTLVLLSLVDGRVSTRETDFIVDVCKRMGLSDARREELEVDAKKYLLASLEGVRHYRDQAVAVGKRLGLSEAQIDEALAE